MFLAIGEVVLKNDKIAATIVAILMGIVCSQVGLSLMVLLFHGPMVAMQVALYTAKVPDDVHFKLIAFVATVLGGCGCGIGYYLVNNVLGKKTDKDK